MVQQSEWLQMCARGHCPASSSDSCQPVMGLGSQRPTLAVAGAAMLRIQVEAAHDVAEDVLLAPAARAPPVAGALRPRRISCALRAAAACC